MTRNRNRAWQFNYRFPKPSSLCYSFREIVSELAHSASEGSCPRHQFSSFERSSRDHMLCNAVFLLVWISRLWNDWPIIKLLRRFSPHELPRPAV